MLSLVQIVLVCTTILALIVWIGAMGNNKKIHNFVIIISIIAIIIIYLLFMYIPIFILNHMYEASSLHTSLLLFFAIIAAYLFLRVGTQIINNYKIKKVKDEGIYIRDIQVDYSPAVLSYLLNQKIEPKKDLVASILNLCSKDALKLIKKENNKFELECIENFDIESLKKDEKYLYESIKKKSKIDIDIWILWVKKEYDKYHFSKKNNIKLWIVMIVLCSLYIMFFDMYNYINGEFTIDDSISKPMLIIFFSAFELLLLELIIRTILSYIKSNEFIEGIYSTKGALEMVRWQKYKKFLDDFTLIKERNIDSVLVLEKHLAYAMALNVNKSYEKYIIEELEGKYNLNFKDIKCSINMKIDEV